MNKLLVIYDNEGFLLSIEGGTNLREPHGVPFAWVDVPGGKRIKSVGEIGVDVTKTPHQVILEDIPPSETKILNDKIDSAVLELTTLIAMGGM